MKNYITNFLLLTTCIFSLIPNSVNAVHERNKKPEVTTQQEGVQNTNGDLMNMMKELILTTKAETEELKRSNTKKEEEIKELKKSNKKKISLLDRIATQKDKEIKELKESNRVNRNQCKGFRRAINQSKIALNQEKNEGIQGRNNAKMLRRIAKSSRKQKRRNARNRFTTHLKEEYDKECKKVNDSANKSAITSIGLGLASAGCFVLAPATGGATSVAGVALWGAAATKEIDSIATLVSGFPEGWDEDIAKQKAKQMYPSSDEEEIISSDEEEVALSDLEDVSDDEASVIVQPANQNEDIGII